MDYETLKSQCGKQLCALAARHGLSNLRVFGSAVRGEAREDSDIDLLVTSGPDVGWGMGGFQYASQELLKTKTDIASGRSIYPSLRAIILQEARPLQ